MREGITTATGAAIALCGIIVFLRAHALCYRLEYQAFNETHHQLHELLWASFGIAIWLGGVIVAAVGIAAWCNNRQR